MMRRKIPSPDKIVVLACLLLAVSCHRDWEFTAFTQAREISLYVAGSAKFVYDPAHCQIASSYDLLTFRAHTDNMSDFFTAEFSDAPLSVGQALTADISWTTPSDILERKNLALEIVRIEGEKIWLWSKSGRIGLVITYLE